MNCYITIAIMKILYRIFIEFNRLFRLFKIKITKEEKAQKIEKFMLLKDKLLENVEKLSSL